MRHSTLVSRRFRLATAFAWAAALGACARPTGEVQQQLRPGTVADTVSLLPVAPAVPPMPIVHPGAVGMSEQMLMLVDSLIEAGIAEGATPGAALAVGRRGSLVRLRGYGRLDWPAGSDEVTDSTIYDVASLTKVVGTTTAAMILDEEGRLDLDAPVAAYLPEWNDETKRSVTVRQLLDHTAGLPAGGPAWREGSREAVVARIAAAPLAYVPGSRSLYSDYDIILLGEIIERVTAMRLDEFLETRVFAPLGLRETGFNPRGWWLEDAAGGSPFDLAGTAPVIDRIAPTEVDYAWRRTHIHGDVHDPIAYAMRGVAGHAGLFSSARDLAVFAQLMLNRGSYGPVTLVRPGTVERYTRRQRPGSSRALGWDTPAPGASAGDFFSAASYGHTGFTGTSIWIDPEQELFVVLLSNRVNPTSANRKHVPLRRAVHDAVQLAVTDRPVERRADAPTPAPQTKARRAR